MSKKEPELYLCRCCHSEGAYESLYSSFCWLDTEEIVYSKLLQECFDIELTPVQQLLQNKLCGICDTCAYRLKDAAQFKRQVKKCEQNFIEVYASYVCEENTQVKHKYNNIIEVTIKEEIDVEYKDDTKNVKDESDENKLKNQNFNQRSPEEHKANKAFEARKCKISMTNAKVRKKRSKLKKSLETTDDEEALEFNNEHKLDKAIKVGKSTVPKSNAKLKKEKFNVATVKKDPEKINSNEELEYIDGISFIRLKSVTVRRNIDFKKTENGLQCLRCTEVVKTRDHISKHIRTVHFNTAKLKCPTCSKLFWDRSTLVRHKLKEHNIDERLKCKACDAAFGSTWQLNNHVASYHMLGNKIKCDECDYETYHKHYMKKHKINHSSEKSYQCRHCHKTFKTPTTLNFHERIHTGDKRKVCTECGQAFVQRASLKYHMLKHHPGVAF